LHTNENPSLQFIVVTVASVLLQKNCVKCCMKGIVLN
jgi:hypothetical protein